MFSCSTTKNTATVRAFHNLTSRYNIYFNGNESFKQGVGRAEESIQNDFTTILPLFYYEDESVQQSVSPQMKRAIDKATKVVTFHSITAKPKVRGDRQTDEQKAFYDKNEFNKWVDDSYMLMGKSYMYQGEFFLAAEAFKHVIRTFPEEESRHLARTWLARAYTVTDQFDEADKILVSLKDVEEFPDEYLDTYYTTLADYHIHLEEYDKAAEYLEQALKTRPKKVQRIRYTYILAQLHQEAGNSEEAIRNFRKVVRMNPPYVMAFNAKVNMAEAYQAGVSGSDEIKKLLNKMLKDSKNKEYLDQIYFALGNIAMEEGEREKAIEYYHKSVSASVQNKHQKGESCLTLAEIYYEEPVYTLSAAYYDTAVNLLDASYPNYSRLQQRSFSLNRLSGNIETYELQDSLQRLAALPEAERVEIIDGIIEEVQRQEEEERRRQQEAMQDLAYSRMGSVTNSGLSNTQQSAGGKWYFYNVSLKSFGQPEFRMKWGDRELEDNWRRSNKQSVTALLQETMMESDSVAGEDGQPILDNKTREFYLKDIPLSDSAMVISDNLLNNALYNAGKIYKDELFDYDEAVVAFKKLVDRTQDADLVVPAYYYLHEISSLRQNFSEAATYKYIISSDYPESHYAKLLNNPNYLSELEAEEQKADRAYERIYQLYKDGRFNEVIRRYAQGKEELSERKDLMMRLDYLKAMSVGALRGKEQMKTELDSLIAWYPGTDIAAEAQEVIDYMYVAFPVIRQTDQVKEAEEIYLYEPGKKHFFAIALKKDQDVNQVNFNLINYNLDNFPNYDLTTEMKGIDAEYNLIIVRGLADLDAVNRYATRVREDYSVVLGEIPVSGYTICTISEMNLTTLTSRKEMVPYLLFYSKHYTEN